MKNQLTYMDASEINTKFDLCEAIGVVPVFVVRMMPRSWILEIKREGGFTLVLKYQLYPRLLTDLAERKRNVLSLPTGTPKRLQDGTVRRFERWHEARFRVICGLDSRSTLDHTRSDPVDSAPP